MMDFVAWPKIARLHKDIVVTEKIDGTNGAIIIETIPNPRPDLPVERRQTISTLGDGKYEPVVIGTAANNLVLVGAQSRKRLITPERDNFGFAKWVFDNAEDLYYALGDGYHYGEWWGSGIQRGYGLPKGEKRFSLFNRTRYAAGDAPFRLDLVPGLGVVPLLYEGPFSEKAIEDAMQYLDDHGSRAAEGFKPPEGVVIWHEAARQLFKWPFDEAPKGTPYTPPEPLTKSNGVWLS